jgi:monothiol glutaredoxin
LLGSRAEDALHVDRDGITILVDPSSARRADGLSVDFVSGPDGSGFKIEHPNEPPRVNQISATELKAIMDRGLPFELVDVRTDCRR